MSDWKHPVALELRHEEKIIGGKLSTRQLLFVVPGVILDWVFLSIPFQRLYDLFLPQLVGEVMRWVTGGLLAIVISLVAMVFAFVPARMIPFFKNPKPKLNLDPYDVEMTMDKYLLLKISNKGKKKLLPYRVVR